MTLDRVQSGVGVLALEMVHAATAGDLALGCLLERAAGTESVVQALGGRTQDPPGAEAPLVWLTAAAGRESLHLDLRQIGELRRAMVYGFSPSGSVVGWDGLVVARTYGGSRIEIPFDRAPSAATLVIATIYNVRGELVLRAECQEIPGPPEAAAIAFDYHLSWLEGTHPPA